MTRFMPKVFSAVLLTMLAPLTMGLGNPEYDPMTGALTLKAVDVYGKKTYENVVIMLDFATGKFTIPRADVADTRIPEVPVQVVTKNGLDMGIRGCIASGSSVTCHLLIRNKDFNRSVIVFGNYAVSSCCGTNVYDNLGNSYRPATATVSNVTDTRYVTQTLIANVVTPVSITVNNVSTSATSFSSLVFRIRDETPGAPDLLGEFEFKNIPF